MACRHHPPDETCADCTPGAVDTYEKPGRPVSKQRGLEHVHEIRRRLRGEG